MLLPNESFLLEHGKAKPKQCENKSFAHFKVKIVNSELFDNRETEVADVRKSHVMVHYVKAKAQNKIYKLMLFDELQRKYGELVGKVNASGADGRKLVEEGGHRAFTVPPNEVFEMREDREAERRRAAREKEKESAIVDLGKKNSGEAKAKDGDKAERMGNK